MSSEQSASGTVRAPALTVPLHIVRPTFPPLESFGPAFQEALGTGQVTNNGRWVVEFERRLTEYLGVPTLVFCNGQVALQTMLIAAGVAGGEVIVPSFTFAASPHAVRMAGAEPVFADIADDGSMCMDPEAVRKAITDRTVAILGVDSYGVACAYDELAAIGRAHRIKVLFDSAPSFGTRVDGQLVGGFGDAQIFSFHATKAFATMEGGCLCSRDGAFLERVRAVRNFGQVPGGDCLMPGTNGKMTEVSALIGLEQLKTFDVAVANRLRCADRIRAGLEKIPGLTLGRAPAGQEPVWLYLPVEIDRAVFGLDREAAAAALERENLFVRKYYSPPCHHMTVYLASRETSLPVTERVAYNVLALPIFNDMTGTECDGIIAAFAAVYGDARTRARTPDLSAA